MAQLALTIEELQQPSVDKFPPLADRVMHNAASLKKKYVVKSEHRFRKYYEYWQGSVHTIEQHTSLGDYIRQESPYQVTEISSNPLMTRTTVTLKYQHLIYEKVRTLFGEDYYLWDGEEGE